MSLQGHEQPCYYCGEPCDSLAANPSKWPIGLCHSDEAGKVKWHHEGCIAYRVRIADEILKGDPEQMIEWIEPYGPDNEPVYMRLPRSTVIALQRSSAMKHSDYAYETDDKAVEDFMVVHWAQYTVASLPINAELPDTAVEWLVGHGIDNLGAERTAQVRDKAKCLYKGLLERLYPK